MQLGFEAPHVLPRRFHVVRGLGGCARRGGDGGDGGDASAGALIAARRRVRLLAGLVVVRLVGRHVRRRAPLGRRGRDAARRR